MKNIFITGTSSGIGKFVAQNMQEIHTIYGISRNSSNLKIQEFLGNINDETFLSEIYKKVPEIDWLILNAGVGYFDTFKNISLEEHKEIIQTNLLSPIIFTSIFLDKIKSGIIFIGSISSKKSGKYGASYSASKFGLRGFAMNLKNEIKQNIHIINPKVVKTNFHKNSKIEIQGKFEETNLEDILQVINEIIQGKEKRFEIDL
ncbi:MAG: SDR family NAD(P)-dependent oxidoreductase [Candidatus Altimarinota bacterium]